MFSRKELRSLLYVPTCIFIIGLSFFYYNAGPDYLLGGPDFPRTYSVAQMLREGRGTDIYNTPVFLEKIATLENSRDFPKIFLTGWLYPPVYSLLLEPLAYLPYKVSFYLSIIAQAALLYAAGYGFLWHNRYDIVPASSFTAMTALLSGQNGVLVAALCIAAFRFLDKKPLFAGAILGTLIIKPQMGVLIPVMLLAGGYYSACITAMASMLFFVVVSMCCYGAASWLGYFQVITEVNTWDVAERFATSIYATLYHIGVPRVSCKLGQIISAIVAVCLLICRHSEWRNNPKMALWYVSILTLFVSPYLGIYDYVLAATMTIFALLTGNKEQTFGYVAPIILFLAIFVVPIQIFFWFTFQLVVAPFVMVLACMYIEKDKRLRFSCINE